MNRQELEFILQEGEGQKIEFKQDFGSDLDRDIVGFANAQGGRIFVGISDDSKVIGLRIDNRLRSQIRDLARKCDPPISIVLEEINSVLVIYVPEGANKPYRCSSGFYLRQGPNSQKLTRDEIIDFAIGEGKIRFDEQLNLRFRYPGDFDDKKLEDYLAEAGATRSIATEEILVNLEVARKEDARILFNNAGVLMFAEKPQRFFRQAYVTCVRYKGMEKLAVIDRQDIGGSLIESIEDSIKFVRKNTRLAYRIEGLQREELSEYPMLVIREAIVNAVMHRDYFEKGANTFVEIYDDRIEISNPGGLVKGLDPNDFGKRSVRRNPLLADLLQRAQYVEKIGTGINRMRQLMKEYGLEEPEFMFTDFFTVTFVGPGESALIETEEFLKGLTDEERVILEMIEERGHIKSKHVQEHFDVSRDTANRYLNQLLRKGLIVRKGEGKATHYELK